MKKCEFYVGIDIGGTKCAVTLGEFSEGDSSNIVIVDKCKFLTNPEEPIKRNPYDVLNEFVEATKVLLEKNNGIIKRIGISCGGPLDSKSGVIMSPPNLPGWDNIEVVRFFEEKFDVECLLQNDADACAVAEWKFGAGKGMSNMIFLTFGTGLGAGLILNGKLYTGASNMAGEIGHVLCEAGGPVGYSKEGSFEGFCSGGGIAKLGEMMGIKGGLSSKDIAQKAREGDALCQKVYAKSGEMLGKLLSILIDLLNPDAIIIGGVFARSYDLLLPYAEKVIEKEALPQSRRACKILPAGLGEFVGDYSALAVAGLL